MIWYWVLGIPIFHQFDMILGRAWKWYLQNCNLNREQYDKPKSLQCLGVYAWIYRHLRFALIFPLHVIQWMPLFQRWKPSLQAPSAPCYWRSSTRCRQRKPWHGCSCITTCGSSLCSAPRVTRTGPGVMAQQFRAWLRRPSTQGVYVYICILCVLYHDLPPGLEEVKLNLHFLGTPIW